MSTGSGFSMRVFARRFGRIKGSPRLNRRFETSVERFHVIGPASALSFGPLFRFVVGAHYTVRILTPHFAAHP